MSGTTRRSQVGLWALLLGLSALATPDAFAGTRTILAIIGDGVDLTHEDLVNRALRDGGGTLIEQDFIDGSLPAAPAPGAWRATALAGVAAAQVDNGLGIDGVCADCRLLNIRADTTSPAAIKQAVEWAINTIKTRIQAEQGSLSPPAEGVIVIDSQQDLGRDALLENLLNDVALQQGPLAVDTSIVVVAPAGNGKSLGEGLVYPTDEPSYPCATTDATGNKLVFCVGSVDTAPDTLNQRSVFSNYGFWVDLYAPGQRIVATLPGSQYGFIYDTGAAAAIVAGVAGMTYHVQNPTPLAIQESLRFGADMPQPALGDPNLRPPLFEPTLNASSTTAIAAGGSLDPVAKLDQPLRNSPLTSGQTVDIRGSAVGDGGYTISVLRYGCCPRAEVQVATLHHQTAAVDLRRSNSLLKTWTLDSGLAEGEYAIKLEVRKTAMSPAVVRTPVFLDKSYDATFNSGTPRLTNDIIVHGPNLVDLNQDGTPELIVGSAKQKKVYAFTSTGTTLFESPALSGRIFGAPAVGDLDGDGDLELVAAADVSAAPSLYAWHWQTASPVFAPTQIGAMKSAPVLAKASPSATTKDIFVTLKTNQLRWYSGTGAFKAGATLTEPKPFCANAAYACNGKPLMESTPLVASLQSTTPMRVFVPSQDPFTSYGFAPKDGATPALQLLPGLPMPWFSSTQPAPGGMFDAAVAPFDNAGALQMFVVQYLRDQSACVSVDCQDTTQLFLVEVQGATTTEPTNARVKKNKDFVTDSIFRIDNPATPTVETELFMYSGTAAGDLRRGDNGEVETVVVGMSGKVYAFDAELKPLVPTVAICPDGATPGWPQQMGGRGSGAPLLTDLDNDGQQEVITTSLDQLVYAFDANGCLKRTLADGRYGFPRATRSPACSLPKPAESPLRNWAVNDIIRCAAPATSDLDADGRNELIAVASAGPLSTNAIYVWDFGQSGLAKESLLERLFAFLAPAEAEALNPAPVPAWPTSHGNARNTGAAYQVPIVGTVTDGQTAGPMPNAAITVTRAELVLQPALDPLDANGNGLSDQVDAGLCEPTPTGPGDTYQCWPSVCRTTTDEDGSYQCPVNPGATYRVLASAVGYTLGEEPNIPVSHDDPQVGVDFTLLRAPGDNDWDGFMDSVELSLGTNPGKACPATPASNDESIDPWPPDFDDNGIVDISDVFAVASRFGAQVGDGNYSVRYELASVNGAIGIDDVYAVSGRFSQRCTLDDDTDTDSLGRGDPSGLYFRNGVEGFLGTDSSKACAATTVADDEPVDAWPPDFNDDRTVDGSDLFLFAQRFGTQQGVAPPVGKLPYARRFDVYPVGTSKDKIDGSDTYVLAVYFGKSCTP